MTRSARQAKRSPAFRRGGREIHGHRGELRQRHAQGSYTVILEGNNTVVLYGARAIDLTESIIKTYNEKGPAKVSQAGGKTPVAN